MTDIHSLKVLLARLIFLLLVVTSILVVKHDHADNLILIGIVIVSFGVMTITKIKITNSSILIKRNYFWGLVPITYDIPFNRIISIHTKDYDIENDLDSWSIIEDILSYFVIELFQAKIKWQTSKLKYIDDQEEKSIEVQLSKEGYEAIEKEVSTP